MAFVKESAGRSRIDLYTVDLARLGENGLFERLAVAQAQDAVGEIDGASVGPDVYQLGGEIRVAD